jgi:hypothetical protein
MTNTIFFFGVIPKKEVRATAFLFVCFVTEATFKRAYETLETFHTSQRNVRHVYWAENMQTKWK